MVSPSDSFSVLNVEFGAKTFRLEDKESLNMEFVRTRDESDQFTAMTTLSSKRFYIQICKFQSSYIFCFCKYLSYLIQFLLQVNKFWRTT